MSKHMRLSRMRTILKEVIILICICASVFVVGMSFMHYDSIRELLGENRLASVHHDETNAITQRYDTIARMNTPHTRPLSSIQSHTSAPSVSGNIVHTSHNTSPPTYEQQTKQTIEEVNKYIAKQASHSTYWQHAMMEDYLVHKRSSIPLPLNTLPPETRLHIDSIDVTAPIVHILDPPEEKLLAADFGEDLTRGVVQYPGTANIGDTGATLLFGHSSQGRWEAKNKYSDIFAKLSYLEPNDTITVFADGQAYTYKVQTQKIVRPKEVSRVFDEYNTTDNHTLLLMACYPTFTDLQRVIVVATLVDDAGVV